MSKIQKYTFCHIPKTGGVTICDMIYNHAPAHIICTRANSQQFLFAFVRNPYSRCLSAFQYLKRGGMNGFDKNDSDRYIGNSDFENFVLHKLKYASKNQQHFRPQHYWIPDGVDFLGKYENLEEDLQKLSHIINMKNKPIPHKNQTVYNKQYNMPDQTKNMIYQIYKKDFELFNYEK